MRRIFLFWSFILLILILGTIAIIYGKRLLKIEHKKQDRIIGELALRSAARARTPLPSEEEKELEETPEGLEPSWQPLPKKDKELPAASEEIVLPDVSKIEELLPPRREAPAMEGSPDTPEPVTPAEPVGE